MNTFINYSTNNGLTIDTFRDPSASVTDIADIASAISSESTESLTCSIEGNELDVLEDCAYWQGQSVTQEALETLHDLISKAV